MADTGFLNPGTTADDATVGTIAWVLPSNAVSSNDVYATAALSVTEDFNVDDNSIKLYSGGAFVGNEKASATNWSNGTDATRTYGGAADKWGLTPTESDVENSGWGVGISCQRDASTPESHYLLVTNFGVAITASSIDGIEVTVECNYTNSLSSFIEGTEIATPTGSTLIQKIKSGSRIISYNPKTKQFEKDRVVAVKSRVVDEVYCIRTSRRMVYVTGTHKFFTSTGLVKAKDIRIGTKPTVFFTGIHVHESVEAVTRHKGTFKVYDFQVEKNRSFVANGFAVHNGIIAGSTTASIDHIQMKIYYTAATTKVYLVT